MWNRASISLFAAIVSLLMSWPLAESRADKAAELARYSIAVASPRGVMETSTGGPAMVKSQTDSFYLYGGPGSLEGQFQTDFGTPGGNPDAQGWIGVDLTENLPHWRVTTTNAETLGPVGNHAVAAHHDDTDYVGYGNSWNDWLVISLDVSALGFNTTADTITVDFGASYVHDTEPGFDYLNFQWNQGGAFQNLASIDGSSYDDTLGFYAPVTFNSGPLTYTPADYDDGNVELRITVTTDGGWSDEDGFYPTDGRGAAAIDDIEVRVNGIPVSFADWEPLLPKADLSEGDVSGHDNGAGLGTDGWLPTITGFVGDFSKLYGQFQDIDPCRSNVSPHFTFIDDGTPPNNDPEGRSTGGSLSDNWSYGVPGGWVVNYTGGFTGGARALNNEIWSPPFDWDLPETADDVANGGAVLSFTRWSHMPLSNCIFAVWHVRSRVGGVWGDWQDNNFIYYSNAAAWGNFKVDVTDKIPQGVEQIQIALGVVDISAVCDPWIPDGTPAPGYDNVAFKKYRIGGPLMSARAINLASDGFPNDGSLDGSIRWDMVLDRGPWGGVIVPGDSITVDIVALIPGSSLADPVTGGVMKLAHLMNPQPTLLRTPAMVSVGATLAGTDSRGWDIYAYEIDGAQTTINGDPVDDRYHFDIPDGPVNVNAPHQVGENPIFFPGDVIHYYIESADDLGNVTTLPEDISGFLDFEPRTAYDRVYTVRGLPTLHAGEQPSILFWNDFGHRGGEAEYSMAFAQNGLLEGRDYDTYTTKGPSSLVGNGLGSAGHHGATAAQLDGYDCLVYVSGNLANGLISDGTDFRGNGKSDDVGVLTAWHNAPRPRFHVYFGDDLVDGMVAQGATTTGYVNTVLGVEVLAGDVGPAIDGQTVPVVVPTAALGGSFAQEYTAFGGCLVINDFDQIVPLGGAAISHEFTRPDGVTPYASSVVAGVWWDRVEVGHRKVTAVFPYDLSYVRDRVSPPGWTGISAPAALLGEILAAFGRPPVGPPTGADAPARLIVHGNHPNPFNPRTTIRFMAPAEGQVSVRIYDLRGRRVRTLLDGPAPAGENRLVWDGRDEAGADLASGVYLYRVIGFGQVEEGKMALIR